MLRGQGSMYIADGLEKYYIWIFLLLVISDMVIAERYQA